MRRDLENATGGVVCGELTMTQVCRICGVASAEIEALGAEGLIEPAGLADGEPRFPEPVLRRIRVAVRLQRDLNVNLQGAALALELLEEIERLRARLGDI